MHARLTVIIVAWNHPELLSGCLAAVLRHLPEAQVLVVDNASEPPLTVPDGVTLLRAPRNLGFAGGNNLALPHAEGEHILLLNTDVTLPSAEPIRILQAALDTYPHLAALQPTLILPDGTPVYKGMKSGDVDPRCELSHCYTASDKALAVGGGVLEALLRLSGILGGK